MTDVDLTELLGFTPSDEQRRAITADLEPGVIIAGAGTGKTTVMAARVVWLVATGQVEPQQVLGLTFTRKACRELADRIAGRLDHAGLARADAGATVQTYDGFAASLVDEFGAWIGVDSGARLVTTARCHQIAYEVVRGLQSAPLMASHLRPVSIARAVVALAGQMSAHGVDAATVRRRNRQWLDDLEAAPGRKSGQPYADVADAAAVARERGELVGLVEAYEQRKARLGLVEFADRLNEAVALAQASPQVGAELRSRYRVVLLDEYQDTSTSQARLLRELFTGQRVADGLGHPVTAVGDPLQAIYGWRGAAASNILEFSGAFPRADGTGARPARTFTLTENRRSDQTVLDCANAVSAALRDSAEMGGVVGALRRPSEETEREPTSEVTVSNHETWAQECAAVADAVVEARERGQVASWSQIAVLVRRNSDIADLHAALAGRQVPVAVANLSGLLCLPDVAMVVAHLRLVVDRRDDDALATLLTAARWGLGADLLEMVSHRARTLARARALADGVDLATERPQVHLADALDDPGPLLDSPTLARAVRMLAAEVAAMGDHAADGPDDLVLRAVGVTGLADDIAADDPVRSAARQGQLDALWTQVHQACLDDPELTLAGVLTWLDAEEQFGSGLDRDPATQPDAVVLSTVHGAKGLEWPMVLLPDLAHGVFPSDRGADNFVTQVGVLPPWVRGDVASIACPSGADRDALARFKDDLRAETVGAEDRLAYVALTRAKHVLGCSWHQWSPGRARPRTAGSYIDAVGKVVGQPVVEPATERPGEVDLVTGTSWPQRADAGLAAVREQVVGWLAEGSQVWLPEPDDPAEAELVRRWQEDAELLVARARDRRRPTTELPRALTASQVVGLHADPEALLAELRRPMPRAVSRGATIGTAFHAWVSRRLDPASVLFEEPVPTVPGLEQLKDAFEASRWARLEPVAVEEPFAVVIAGHVVRGRLDAVFEDPDRPGGQVVVDWKTSRPGAADPVQLAIYRLAWAQARGLDPALVRAVFHHVGANRTVEPQELLDADDLAAVLGSRP